MKRDRHLIIRHGQPIIIHYRGGNQIYSTYTMCLAFSQKIVFQMLSTILKYKYNHLHIHRRESWSVQRFADSMRSLSQHFNPYLSDFKSIAVSAFRKRSEAILGYCQKFFFEACNISHRSVIFLYQPWWWFTCPDSLWEAENVLAFSPD